MGWIINTFNPVGVGAKFVRKVSLIRLNEKTKIHRKNDTDWCITNYIIYKVLVS